MRYLNEQEAWYMIAATIEGTDMYRQPNDQRHLYKVHNPSGLCTIAHRMRDVGAISTTTCYKMAARAMKAVRANGRDSMYLTYPGNWSNGVRLEYALKFAKQAAPKSKR